MHISVVAKRDISHFFFLMKNKWTWIECHGNSLLLLGLAAYKAVISPGSLNLLMLWTIDDKIPICLAIVH